MNNFTTAYSIIKIIIDFSRTFWRTECDIPLVCFRIGGYFDKAYIFP
jgi:hypothetical protein